ncbi:ribulose-phosphate 3-epimerase [Methylomonas methanica]|uniref:Ribulose-phosphate 3-epimerase n=1 Tax=Methylomonas methanica (strain DSM 25384 / MC09) TaxID=857087 RepID=F9ZW59_METMM|nr:ribulose-phosphate 3-epimerase [Methylomonas methanica]AEG02030.1 ribulose-phosphate 3-epimerase [Methylomonas methanica MC09]
MNSQPLAQRIYREILPPTLSACADGIAVIGIDGPTAAGKTILADDLAELLHNDGRKVWTYRLDWTLAEREPRLADLDHLRNAQVDTFPFEGELHMRLDLARKFLERIHRFREAWYSGRETASPPEFIQIDHLYSRSVGGRAVGKAECQLEPGLVILLEGHYTARPDLDALIDFNILLLSDPVELLRRKVARVRNYRGEAEAVDYFHRIDLPSFRHHLARFGHHFDLVVDNSDYREPHLESTPFIQAWRGDDCVSEETRHDGIPGLATQILSSSRFVAPAFCAALEASLDALVTWDQYVGDCLRQDLASIHSDLRQQAESLMSGLEQRFAKQNIRFRLRHTHALHQVYKRHLPVSLGITVTAPSQQAIHLLAEIEHSSLRLQVISAAGRSLVRVEREIGSLTPRNRPQPLLIARYHPLGATEAPLPVLTPTPLAVPGFLGDHPLEIDITGEPVSPAATLSRHLDRGGVWVQRFSRFEELSYFDELATACGSATVQAGRYLIAMKSGNVALRRRFKAFQRSWAHPLATIAAPSKDQVAFDRQHDDELDAALFGNVGFPHLEECDRAHFHQLSYRFSTTQIGTIADALGAELTSSPMHPHAVDEGEHFFSASMIEVPFGEAYCRLVDRLVAEGVHHFHIDAGDGRFIPRVIDAIDKVRYLLQHHPQVILHAHLMAEDPQAGQHGQASLIDRYLDAGCHALAIHPRALSLPVELVPTLQHIRRRGARPGLVIETTQPIDSALWEVITQADLDWSVVMGVPVGYGGQLFDHGTFGRLAALHYLSRAEGRHFEIEIDGGLTMDIVEPCRRAGARIFSGWSIVRGQTDQATIEKVKRLRRLLSPEAS